MNLLDPRNKLVLACEIRRMRDAVTVCVKYAPVSCLQLLWRLHCIAELCAGNIILS
jgi:hypothetical protein